MPASYPESPLVYVQDDAFFIGVGDSLPLPHIERVVIGKWDALYAEALVVACGRAFPRAKPQVCRCGRDVLKALRERRADMALLGLTFTDLDGIDVLQAIGREQLAARVMIVSSRQDEHSLQVLRTARFDGYFDPFHETMETLVRALQQIAAGHGYISDALRQQMVEQRSAGVLVPKLTPAELEVFCVIGDGSDDRESAGRLGISVATAQTHRRNIMRKLGIPTSAKLVREAVRLGVVRIQPDGEIVRPGFDRLLANRAERQRNK